MAERTALIAEQQEMATGVYYSAEEEERTYTGRWSDEVFHFLSHPGSCLMCSFLCFWPVLLWQILSRLPRNAELLPLGLTRVSLATSGYAACLLACVLLHGPLALAGFVGSAVILEQTARLVMGRYQIAEPSKVELWLQAVCCHGCLLARLARHVGRARGFIPPLHGFGVEVLPPPVVVV